MISLLYQSRTHIILLVYSRLYACIVHTATPLENIIVTFFFSSTPRVAKKTIIYLPPPDIIVFRMCRIRIYVYKRNVYIRNSLTPFTVRMLLI